MTGCSISPSRRGLAVSIKRLTLAVMAPAVLLAGCGGDGSSAGSSSAASGSANAQRRAAPPATRHQNCFASPSACGYPDPQTGDVGAGDCSSLPSWTPSDLPAGSYTVSGDTVSITRPGLEIRDRNIGNWQLYIDGAPNFTLDGDCVSYEGHASDSSTAVWSTTSGLTVRDSTLIAPGCNWSPDAVCTSQGVDEALISGGAGTTVSDDLLAGAVEPVNGLGAGSVVSDSYIVANGVASGAHSEDVYEADAQGITITHNTLLNPMDQSAVVYGDDPTDNGRSKPCSNRFTITRNLMAGGGRIIQQCSQERSAGTSSMTFTGNDLARCTTSPTNTAPNSPPYSSIAYCGSTLPIEDDDGNVSAIGTSMDTHGYWPNGGSYGVDADVNCEGSGTYAQSDVTWSSNQWDDNGATVSCQ